MGYGHSSRLGWSLNPFDWFGGSDTTTTLPPGWMVGPTGTLVPSGTDTPMTQNDVVADANATSTDQSTINAWSALLHSRGSAYASIPGATTNANVMRDVQSGPMTQGTWGAYVGLPAERFNGPGTGRPNDLPPYTYALAPVAVVDAYNRLRAKETRDQAAYVPPADGETPPATQLLNILKWSAIALGIVVLGVEVMPMIRRANPRGRRRGRRKKR